MRDWGWLALAFVLGASISVYQPLNAVVARITGTPLVANVVFFGFAFLTSLALTFLFGASSGFSKLGAVRPVQLLPGVASAFMVLGTIALLPRLGARRLFLLQVAGQILMAMIVGQFGLVETPQDPLTLRKMLGALLILAGALVSLA